MTSTHITKSIFFNFLLALLMTVGAAGNASAGSAARNVIPLDELNWRVWLDEKAEWTKDTLYMPGEVPAIETLPVNPPTGGWDVLNATAGKACAIPASVEEYFSEGRNYWSYHGVSWFWCDVVVPSAWQGKVIRLQVEKARMRAEIYVNGKLAGYDLVAETPFDVNLSNVLKYGQQNRIAVRLTNPGGQRGWEDGPGIKWSGVTLPASHDFSGLGRLSLVATVPVYIDDIFVKNLPPANARNIEVQVTILNSTASAAKRTVSVAVRRTGVSADKEIELQPGVNKVVFPFTVTKAELWDFDNPKLYECSVSLKGKDRLSTDSNTVRFGFRVFEVKPGSSGGHNFYLNGRRIRYKSAIDWGYYAFTGFYATPEMARKSVAAAKDVGHNGINFHRRIGEPLVMQFADEMGLGIYEEPGAFHGIADNSPSGKVMEEKCRRMTLRDRNHPSLLVINLSNEDNHWDAMREKVLRNVAGMDGSRLVVNTSGAEFTGKAEDRNIIYHIRPYETELRKDFLDYHNACNMGARFNEGAVFVGTHRNNYEDRVYYPGEVISTTGPGNWFLTAEMRKDLKPDRPGYDLNIYTGNWVKLSSSYRDWKMAKAGDGLVRGPADISRLAASGMLYMMGRHAQSIMANNCTEGYAINGWSSGPQSTGTGSDWDSAMCDEARNLKGFPIHYRHWVRPAQVAIFRQNGKYFKPGDKAAFQVNLVNEGQIPQGDYTLKLYVTDGEGKATAVCEERKISVAGGDCFAQPLEPVNVTMDPAWHGGYITLRATLLRDGKTVADGAEQVLLSNRSSYKKEFAGKAVGAVCQWPAAKQALGDAGVPVVDFDASGKDKLRFIAVGAVPDNAALDTMFERVKRDGTLLLVKFDMAWADALFNKEILSKPVKEWGKHQSAGWDGNGWGYLESFVGDQAIPGKTMIGTTGWEVPEDPLGFYPFASRKPLRVYGLYVSRPRIFNKSAGPEAETCTLLVIAGSIKHGKGQILLHPGYPVDANHPFNDMLFYNMLK